jgi:membrane protease YdiL (CAAX protease family)
MAEAGGAGLARRAECLAVFFLLPGALYPLRHLLAFKVVPIMLVVAGACAWWLLRRPGFAGPSLWAISPRQAAGVLALFLPAGALAAAAAWWWIPEKFLAFPLASPGRWALVMLLYPLLAAYPQEVVFRGFFFHRYRGLFPRSWLLAAAGAVSFGLAHSLYGSWVSVALSAAGGGLFGWRYLRTGSLAVAGLEHGLWGDLLFTVGWGWWFHSGSIS